MPRLLRDDPLLAAGRRPRHVIQLRGDIGCLTGQRGGAMLGARPRLVKGVPAMTIDRSQVQVGMEVVGLDATDVGEVKEVRDTDCIRSAPVVEGC